ncbi:MAG TPA: hypothetical protein VG965_05515 [Patescibacteria group bacterium]|nr:hypothetical protein [Patescibacteria group bacterium]
MPEASEQSIITSEAKNSKYKIPIVHMYSGMSPEILTTLVENSNALVLIGPANGGIQDGLLPTVRQVVESGIPVIGLSDNEGAKHGVIRFSDQPQIDALAVGVTYLEKPNMYNTEEVVEAIKKNLDDGLVGQELSNKLKEEFSYKDGEQKPVSELDQGVFPPAKK